MSKTFNINTSEVVAYTNKLEKIHRSAMPVAVRGALNDAAFDMKKNQVEKTFDSEFTVRKKNFIRSHTAVNKSKNTFNLRDMKSEAGVIQGKSNAGDQLETQETGGIIKNRDFIPLDGARISNQNQKLVSKRFYLRKIKAGKVKKNDFVRAVFKAGKDGYILHKRSVFRVDKINKSKGRKLEIETTRLYSFSKNRNVSIKKAPFIKPAGINSSKKIPDFFIERAIRKINKIK